ncbi:hypothetical protein [Phytopseudomonas punonensis]|uniref:DUF4760 domain-containing protein n=1 Tax=Phytopseudomonas punonensis TaxID=1220495 RepID=A0A1M6Z2Q0_9GAMM|nr:hypothetical protein [Pseudomonas punonensis]SHL24801.1 hypothetical protein SAMN05216288_1468 [Pseudomonas punonensis]
MVTTLEIIDSAIKIGLGAIISGITMFVVTNKNQRHELFKMARDDRKNLLREISSKLEEASAALNRGIHSYSGINGDNPDGLKLILESYITINQAKAIASLSGANKLFKEVEIYSNSVLDLYLYTRDNRDLDSDKANDLVLKMNTSWEKMHPLLAEAYEAVVKSA